MSASSPHCHIQCSLFPRNVPWRNLFPLPDFPGSFRLLACFLFSISLFALSLSHCSPTHEVANALDLVSNVPFSVRDVTDTPLHISDHYLLSFAINLPISFKFPHHYFSPTRANLQSTSPSPSLTIQTLTPSPLYHWSYPPTHSFPRSAHLWLSSVHSLPKLDRPPTLAIRGATTQPQGINNSRMEVKETVTWNRHVFLLCSPVKIPIWHDLCQDFLLQGKTVKLHKRPW